ncbi:MAG: flagellar motor switch protein FliM [Planctomycetota bacterium]|nr:flagellar motor switch protein FliM [Planctomycetota bacterium]
MNDILSSEEIESLLSAVSKGDVRLTPLQQEARGTNPDARVYDFTHPSAPLGQSKKILDAIHEALARNLSSSLSMHMAVTVEARVAGFEQMSYAELERRFPAVGTFAIAQLEGVDLKALMVISPQMGSQMIDRLCGGTGVPGAQERMYTEIEQDLMDEILGYFLEEWNAAWTALPPAKVKLESRCSSSQWVRYLSSEEQILSASLEVRMNENVGVITIAYPSRLVHWIAEHFGTENGNHLPSLSESAGTGGDIKDVVDQVPIPVEADLGLVRLRLRDILTLSQGDVLLMDKHVGESMELKVGGQLRYRGFLGAHQEKMVFGITQKL